MNDLTTILFNNKPLAKANIYGNDDYPNLFGTVSFYNTSYKGLVICAEIYNLPQNLTGFYGFHIHEYGNCTPPFNMTGNHYNPDNTAHPLHSGDLLPLLSSNGYAWMAFYDERFNLKEILGKSIVIHDMRDDFTTQPSGDSGIKIGCGIITKV